MAAAGLLSPAAPAPGRIESVDVLRGLTILVMIFVNDVAGVGGTPKWMQHFYPYDADGMTFVDVVFPAFLFIVGVAIPFAIGRRLEAGEPLWRIGRHVLVRTVGLLVVGVFMVNTEISRDQWASPLSPALWKFLMYSCVVLVWNAPPPQPCRRRTVILILRGVGIAGLIILAALYRRADGSWMQHSWWGILGLIGWAYLTATVFYTIFRRNLAALVGVMTILFMMYFVDATHGITWKYLKSFVSVGSMLGSHAAITMAGVILGSVLRENSPVQSHAARIRWALLYGAALWIAGMLLYSLRSVEGMERLVMVNKNLATPTWGLYCAAITAWVWVGIYVVMDVVGFRKWAIVLRPAGENPLFAYVLAPLVYNLLVVLHINKYYDSLGMQFSTGFWRSVLWAFGITWLAGLLKKWGVRLRL